MFALAPNFSWLMTVEPLKGDVSGDPSENPPSLSSFYTCTSHTIGLRPHPKYSVPMPFKLKKFQIGSQWINLRPHLRHEYILGWHEEEKLLISDTFCFKPSEWNLFRFPPNFNVAQYKCLRVFCLPGFYSHSQSWRWVNVLLHEYTMIGQNLIIIPWHHRHPRPHNSNCQHLPRNVCESDLKRCFLESFPGIFKNAAK